MEMLVNLAHAQTNFPAADEASYPRKRGKNAGKQAKAAWQVKFRRHCVHFNGLFLVVYFDFCVCCKILCSQQKL
jgi:hypothetical protein